MRQKLGLVLLALLVVFLWATGLLYSQWQLILGLTIAILLLYFITSALVPSKRTAAAGLGAAGAAAGIANKMSSEDGGNILSDIFSGTGSNTSDSRNTSSPENSHGTGPSNMPGNSPRPDTSRNPDTSSSPSRGDNNLNGEPDKDDMGAFDRVKGALNQDEEVEQKELSDMGQLAERIEKEMGDLEKEEQIDGKMLQDIQRISQHLRQLMEHEGEMKELLAKGVNIGNYDQTLPRVQELAQTIQQEGNQVSEEFEQLKKDINAQTGEAKEIAQDESQIKELAQAVSSEHDRHQQILSQAENVLQQELLGDHPYSNQ